MKIYTYKLVSLPVTRSTVVQVSDHLPVNLPLVIEAIDPLPVDPQESVARVKIGMLWFWIGMVVGSVSQSWISSL